MVVWMLYVGLVGGVLATASHLLDPVLRHLGWPRRGLWLGALAAATVLPWALPGLAAVLAPDPLAVLGTPTVVAPPGVDPTLPVEASHPWLAVGRLDTFAGGFWGIMSALLLAHLALSALRLSWHLRRLPAEGPSPHRVLRDASLGPAVVGLLRPRIVLPSWLHDAPEGDLRLILAHEGEHVRARDNLTVFIAYLMVVAMPFNPGGWILFRRLKRAVEEDCDARVLAGRGLDERLRYGHLLLEVGRRMQGHWQIPTPAAFAESGSHLERRIRTMYRLHRRPTRRSLAFSVMGAALLVVSACLVPGPDAPTLTSPEVEAVATEPVGSGQVADDAGFTPFDQAPELLNRDEVSQAVTREYPPLLRDAGIGGQVRVWLHVDETGAVTDLRIDETSGHRELDAAAMRVAAEMAFAPARHGEEPVAVWIAMPVAFGRAVDEGGAAVSKGPPTPPVDRAELAEEPAFTPYTVAPDLVNRSLVGQALEANYPEELRNRGIGGTSRVWFLIDETGAVADVRLSETSGHPAIDDAALRVARIMEFTPALNRDETVPVWVSFPITFQVR